MSIATLAQMEAHFGTTHYDYLDQQADIPVITGPDAQGDVMILNRPNKKAATTPIPAAGVAVVRGENGHTHALFGPGMFDQKVATADDLSLGTLTVPAGMEVPVMLDHPEHGAYIIAPGTYELRRQRTQADVTRLVAD